MGVWKNGVGVLGSGMESLRVPTAMLSSEVDMKIGSITTKAREAMQQSRLIPEFIKPNTLKDQMVF